MKEFFFDRFCRDDIEVTTDLSRKEECFGIFCFETASLEIKEGFTTKSVYFT